MTDNSLSAPQSALAILPLLSYLLLFIGVGAYFQLQGTEYAFYQLSPVVAILPAIIFGIAISKQRLNDAISTFMEGVGNRNIIAMCVIYLLAGAFAAVAKATGGVDAVVNLGLTFIPASLLLPGIFIICAVIATSMGTSMGTIAAVAPVAFGLSDQAGIDLALMSGVVLSGAIFGDNLSIISDTTIAATRTQGAQMQDKFKENLRIATPTALITIVLFTLAATGQATITPQPYEITKVIPYLTILVLAIAGLNVFLVLTIGILMAGITAMIQSGYGLMTFGQDIYSGFSSMQEIFLLSMLVGGLAALMSQQGGITWVTSKIAGWIGGVTNAKAAEVGMGSLVAAINVCVANNTVAIIVAGPVAKKLAEQHKVAPRRAAATLDVFSCIVQGLLPFGAQALLLASTFGLSPFLIVSHSWYCVVLAIVTLATIIWRKR